MADQGKYQEAIAAFERAYSYDSGYVYEILDVGVRAVLLFNRIMPMSRYRHDAPRDKTRNLPHCHRALRSFQVP